MAPPKRPAYVPPSDAAPRSPQPPQHGPPRGSGGRQFVFAAAILALVALGAFAVRQFAQGPEPLRIVAQEGPFKEKAPPAPEVAPATELLDQALEGGGEGPVAVLPAPEQPLPESGPTRGSSPVEMRAAAGGAAGSRKAATASPAVAGQGPYVAQIAALSSALAADEAWIRLSKKAPSAFAGARKDVQRADLGAKGVYFRLRAGYFADRAEAGRFCELVKQAGQDCLVVSR